MKIQIVSPRTIMYNENDGQHPGLNTFYQMVTMFDISVDQYLYPAQNSDCSCRKRIDTMLNSLDEKGLQVVEAIIQALKNVRETEDGEWCHPTSLWSTADHNCIFLHY